MKFWEPKIEIFEKIKKNVCLKNKNSGNIVEIHEKYLRNYKKFEEVLMK